MTTTMATSEQSAKAHTVEISVNGKTVTMPDKESTGLEIKTAAMAQSVSIELSFVLQMELPNGTSKIVGDTDVVKVHRGSSFTAIRPDDNS